MAPLEALKGFCVGYGLQLFLITIEPQVCPRYTVQRS